VILARTVRLNYSCPNDPNKIDFGNVAAELLKLIAIMIIRQIVLINVMMIQIKLILENMVVALQTLTAIKDNTPNCFDKCPDDPNKIIYEECGCGVANTDSDKDNTLDCFDSCPNDSNKIEPGKCGCGIVDSECCKFTNSIGMAY